MASRSIHPSSSRQSAVPPGTWLQRAAPWPKSNRIRKTFQETQTMADVPLLRCFVDGQWIETPQRFPNINPVNGQLVAQVCEADAATVDRAVQAANRASKETWRTLNTQERAVLLHRIADGIEQRFDDFVQAEVLDTGRPVHQARSLDVARGIANFRTFADLIKTGSSEMFEGNAPDGARIISYVTRKPLGAIGIISPWNLPLL